MDETNEQALEGAPLTGDPQSFDTVPMAHAAGRPAEPLMPLSMPPFEAPPAFETRVAPREGAGAQDPTLDDVRTVGPDAQIPGTALPGAAGGAPPSGGQPPYLPPYGYGWSPGGLPYDDRGVPAPDQAPHRRALAALGVVALLAGGLGAGLGVALGGTGSSGSSSSSVQPLPQAPSNSLSSTGTKMSVSAIAGSVEPAVVDIRTTVASPVGQSASAAGTGMIVTSSGEVLTNNHVVENATSIRVGIANHSGSFAARVIGVNPTRDVALLQIEGVSHLPYVNLGNSSTVAVGDPVVAVGNALGLGGTPSVVSGQVSALGRTITASDANLAPETLHHLIQTTAQIQPGDSGGPLLDASGRVIGMDTAAASGETGTTVGFAIPINDARAIVEQMQHHQAVGGNILGASPFLGIYELTSGSSSSASGSPFGGLPGFSPSGTTGTPPPSGVTLGGVVASSPAERAGLQSGDVITAIDGTPTPTWPTLQKLVQAKQPGQQITIDFVAASGAAQTATVVLAALPK